MARLLMLITLAACAAGVCHADDDPDAQGNFRGNQSLVCVEQCIVQR